MHAQVSPPLITAPCSTAAASRSRGAVRRCSRTPASASCTLVALRLSLQTSALQALTQPLPGPRNLYGTLSLLRLVRAGTTLARDGSANSAPTAARSPSHKWPRAPIHANDRRSGLFDPRRSMRVASSELHVAPRDRTADMQ